MKTQIIAGLIFGLGFIGIANANPDQQRQQCMTNCDSAHSNWSMEHSLCVGDCWKEYHKATGQGGSQYQSSADPGWIDHTNTQMAEGSTGSDGTTYGEDGSVVGAAEQPTMIAQPTGHGGFGGGGFGGGGTGGGGTSEPDPQQCQWDCGQEHTNEDAYSACINECTASAEPRVMIANTRIGDPTEGSCSGTDPWSCFNGTDDSPNLRNVDPGIFGVFADSSGR